MNDRDFVSRAMPLACELRGAVQVMASLIQDHAEHIAYGFRMHYDFETLFVSFLDAPTPHGLCLLKEFWLGVAPEVARITGQSS